MNTNAQNNDIIAALATPYGKSAVAVIRMSGSGAIELANRFLSRELKPGEMIYNTFKTEKFKERLLAAAFRAPKSFSGEDTVELYPHGSMTVCDGIIKTLIAAGARAAERGEFTKRAFLNGKLDLMQCEALADIIDAQTAEQLNYGNKRYDGGFKGLEETEQTLKTALGTIEAILHYGDELEGGEQDEALVNDVYSAIGGAIKTLEKEINGFAGGKIINDGFKIALIGEPNVGKSTLINALTDSDRAIVTDIAGTTRDTVDEEYIYCDRKFVVTDTAGLRNGTDDGIEKLGMERSRKAALAADAVVFIATDGKKPPKMDGIEKSFVVENKCDGETDVGKEYEKCQNNGVLRISAKNKINITALKQKIYDLCPKDHGSICNHRQYACAVRCLESLKQAQKEIEKACGLEITAALLYDAYSAISEMYGEKADENIISSVFERFCVGK